MVTRRRKESKTSARKVRGAANTLRALELRRDGLSYEAIGVALGLTMQGAHVAIKRGLDQTSKLTGETAEEVRTLEVLRYDNILDKLTPGLTSGDPLVRARTGEAMLKVSAARRALLGLDAPVRTQVDAKIEVTSGREEIEIMVARINARALPPGESAPK